MSLESLSICALDRHTGLLARQSEPFFIGSQSWAVESCNGLVWYGMGVVNLYY